MTKDEKMSFKDLQYLVFEGGGAKGAAYTGAIKALEEGFSAAHKKQPFKEVLGQKKSVLDYISEVDKKTGEKNTQIKGFAGTSAGAITAFALTLGLNSDEIDGIFKDYNFIDFLASEEEHAGKYRMVGKNKIGEYKLYIAESDNDKLGDIKKDFNLTADKYMPIEANTSFWRILVISLGVNVVIDGVLNQVDNFQKIVTDKSFFKPLSSLLSIPGVSSGWNRILSSGLEVSKLLFYRFIIYLFKSILEKKKKIPEGLDIDYSTIGNLIWDKGMFSGFKVREFFFDLLIYSLSKDTHFRRKIIRYSDLDIEVDNNIERSLDLDDLVVSDFNNLAEFKIGKRIEVDKKLKKMLDKLGKSLTFKVFYEITGVDFGVAVSNSTTDSSLYFSHKHTPDYPVLEAVAASMNIPGVFKPIYTEADVWLPKSYNEDDLLMNPITADLFLDKKIININMKEYYIYEKRVKQYLKNKNPSYIDLQAPLNESGYLPLLRNVINKKEEPLKHDGVTFNLLVFFYNTAYKGLLVDGGVANNIPYDFFRDLGLKDDTHELNNILALKLDDEFPPEMYSKVYPSIQIYLNEYKRVMKSSASLEETNTEINTAMVALKVALKPILNLMEMSLEDEELDKFIEKLTSSFVNDKEGETPWNKPKGLTEIVIGSLMYGSEHGQIQQMSDHKHIIPLYTYGVGTMDFDMKKIPNLVQMSKDSAEQAIRNYFQSIFIDDDFAIV